jgi:hypothetical protein
MSLPGLFSNESAGRDTSLEGLPITPSRCLENAWGTFAAALKVSNTFGDDGEALGWQFDHQTVPSAVGPIDLDWYTDIEVLSVGGSGSYSLNYFMAKTFWNVVRGDFEIPGSNPATYDELNAVRALSNGKTYHDLYPPGFMQQQCGAGY